MLKAKYLVVFFLIFCCMALFLISCSKSEEKNEAQQKQNASTGNEVELKEAEPEDEGITPELAELRIFYGLMSDPLDSEILLGDFYDGILENGLEVPEISKKHMVIFSPYNEKRIEIDFQDLGDNRIIAVGLEIPGQISCDNSMDCLLFFMPLLSRHAGLTEYYNQKFSSTVRFK